MTKEDSIELTAFTEGKKGSVAQSRAQPNVAMRYGQQLRALLYKNFVLLKRNWFSSFMHVFGPSICVFLFAIAVVLSKSFSVNLEPQVFAEYGSSEGLGIKDCLVFDSFGGRYGVGFPLPDYPCVPVVYAPSNSSHVQRIMTYLKAAHSLNDDQIIGFESVSAMRSYFERIDGPVVNVAYAFDEDMVQQYNDPLTNFSATEVIGYEMWYNKSALEFLGDAGGDPLGFYEKQEVRQGPRSSYLLGLQRAVSEAMIAAHTGKETELNVKLKPFVYVPSSSASSSSGANAGTLDISSLGALFYLVGILFSFIITLRQLVEEKESRILDALRMMGLFESVYWLSWLIFYSILNLFSSLMMVLAGLVSGLPQFVHSDFMVEFLVLYVYLMSMVAFAMTISTLLPSTKMAILAGFFILIISLIFQFFISVLPVIGLLYDPQSVAPAVLGALNLYPPMLFTKIDHNIYGTTKERINGITGETYHASYGFSDLSGGLYQHVDIALIPDLEAIAVSTEYSAACVNGTSLLSKLCLNSGARCSYTLTEPIYSCLSNAYSQCFAYDNYEDCPVYKSCKAMVFDICDVCTQDYLEEADMNRCLTDGNSWIVKNATSMEGACKCLYIIPSDGSSLSKLFGLVVLYVFLAWYLGQVITFGHGRPESPLFPLTPWYWFNTRSWFPRREMSTVPNGPVDDDVLAEEQHIREGNVDHDEYPVVMRSLVKVFSGLCGRSFRAVNGMTLSFRKGEVFALLGHNGAGKTTAINLMTGCLNVSGGDCTIYGKSIVDNMSSIRSDVGVCPQYDILWGDMTAKEHVTFYGRFQGMNEGDIKSQGDHLLKQVHLDKLQRLSKNYSGGMRRRLSMIIAALGNKKIVFLDEPTTGLDPQNQRHVWDVINEMKQDRVVILTTHLLEEADTLGDRIGIMSEGKLVALGNALHLKKKFGGRYKVAISPASPAAADSINAKVKQLIPTIIVKLSSANQLLYEIEEKDMSQASKLFRWIDSAVSDKMANDWGLSQTSLEDVFISLAEASHHKGPAVVEEITSSSINPSDSTGFKFGGNKESMVLSPSAGGHVKALFRKTAILQFRQRKTLMCQLLFPIALLVLWAVVQSEVIGDPNSNNYSYDQNLLQDESNCFSTISNQFYSALQYDADNQIAANNTLDYNTILSDLIEEHAADIQVLQMSNYPYCALEPCSLEPALANIMKPGNFFFDYFTTIQKSSSCVDMISDAGNPDYLFDPAAWVSSDPSYAQSSYSFENTIYSENGIETLNTQVSLGGRGVHVLVGAKDAGTKSRVGNRCIKPVFRADVNTSTVKCPYENSYECLLSDPTYCSFNAQAHSYCARDEQYVTFDESSTSGLLSFLPTRMIALTFGLRDNSQGSGGSSSPADIELGQGTSFFSSISACTVDGADDDTAAINDLLYQAQLKNDKGAFDESFDFSVAGAQRAIEYHDANFPTAALIFSKYNIDGSKIEMDFEIQSSYLVGVAPTEKNECTDYNQVYTYPLMFTAIKKGLTTSIADGCGLQSDSFHKAMSSRSGDGGGDKKSSSGYSSSSDTQLITEENFLLNALVSAVIGHTRSTGKFDATSTPYINLTSDKLSIRTGARPFPYGINKESEQDDAVALALFSKYMGAILLPLATSFLLPVLVFHLVHEKELKLRSMMMMMGLKMRAYWFVQYLFDFLLALTMLALVYFVGLALGILVFKAAQFGVMLAVFFMWANVMTTMSFLLSVFFSRGRNANIACYFFVLLTVIVSLVLNLNLFDKTPFKPAPGWFVWFPPFAYYRALYLLVQRSYYWADMGTGDELSKLIGLLFLQAMVMGLLSFYLDEVIPTEYGTKKSPFFCIVDGCNKKKLNQVGVDALVEEEDIEIGEGVDPDVAKETQFILANGGADAPVCIRNIKKHFGSFTAVNGVNLHMDDRSVFSLLGPNGAGKTTVISMLTGLFAPSGGDAFVNGYSINSQMGLVHESIGVCPQHDITWPELTIREHLNLYCQLKGVPGSLQKSVVQASLESVQLTEHAYKRSRQLSGGQRRRLSLAIAFIGNPAVVFLDEPTTGVDPETRTHIHDLIMHEKKSRCIVLTTHLMSESELLSDRIGIMAHGELMTLGTAQNLKAKFNQGFKLLVVLSDTAKGVAFVQKKIAGAVIESQVNQKAVFRIDNDAKQSISDVFDIMMQQETSVSGIVDWGVRQTSLEEVFIQLAQESENKHGTA